jgi:hypothetical protein
MPCLEHWLRVEESGTKDDTEISIVPQNINSLCT